MDYEEEQRNEIEALESIYFNELKGYESHELAADLPVMANLKSNPKCDDCSCSIAIVQHCRLYLG